MARNPDFCKATVCRDGGWSAGQCSRRAKRDGYCTQHHPDSVAKRDAAREERYREQDRRWKAGTRRDNAKAAVLEAAEAFVEENPEIRLDGRATHRALAAAVKELREAREALSALQS